MGLTASAKGGGDWQNPPEGSFVARCIRVIDIGHQQDRKWGWVHRCLIYWELPTELVEFEQDGESKTMPHIIRSRYTVSLDRRSYLYRDLKAWRGVDFTEEELHSFAVKNILDTCCMLQVTHKEHGGNTYANVTAIMKLPKGTEVPPRVHDLVLFELDEWDQAVFDGLSDSVQDNIRASREWSERTGPGEPVYSEPAEGEKTQQQLMDTSEEIPF